MDLLRSLNKNLGLILLGERADSEAFPARNFTKFPAKPLLPAFIAFGECFDRIDIHDELPAFLARFTTDRFFRLYWLQLILGLLGVVATALFIAAAVKAIAAHRVSRKYYLLLLNRVCADNLLILSLLPSSYYNMGGQVTAADAWINFLSQLCFWAAMVTYVTLSLLKLYGIARPLHYRSKMIASRCKRIVAYSWLTFALLIVGLAVVGTLVERIASHEGWISYVGHANRFLGAFPAITYAITVGSFVVTLLFIRRAQRFAFVATQESRRNIELLLSQQRFQIPLIKLSMHVASFAIFHLPITLWSLYNSLVDDEHKYRTILCVAKRHFHLVQSIDGVLKSALLFRILLDALVGFMLDRELRAQLPVRRWISWCGGESAGQEEGRSMTTTKSSKSTESSRVDEIEMKERTV